MSEALLARQIKNVKDIHGPLARVYCAQWDNCLLLIFEDGQWAHYRASGGEDTYIELERDRPDWGELLHAGLMTNDEYLAQRASEREESEHAQRQRDLDLLAKLKAKYES